MTTLLSWYRTILLFETDIVKRQRSVQVQWKGLKGEKGHILSITPGRKEIGLMPPRMTADLLSRLVVGDQGF